MSPSDTFHDVPRFPYHTSPRTWLIASGLSASGLRLARTLLAHGDNVVLGTPPATYDEVSLLNPNGPSTPFRRPESELLRQFLLDEIEPLPSDYNDEDGDDDTTASPNPSANASAAGSAGDWRARFRLVRLNPRAVAQCQGAVAQTVNFFGRLDVLVCNCAEVLIGAVEELGASREARAMIREQFEVNFFANVNVIKAALPVMRRQSARAAAAASSAPGSAGGSVNGMGGGGGDGGGVSTGSGHGGGHIIVLTGITSHLGTPGLGAFCASGWALEGYCDSIAYEVAPFNIKLTIIQPHLETAVLPNRIKAAAMMSQYSPSSHPAPLARNSIGSLLDRIQELSPNSTSNSTSSTPGIKQISTSPHPRDSPMTNGSDDDENNNSGSNSGTGRKVPKSLGSKKDVVIREPMLPDEMADALLEETLFSICAIGGHPNPPQRHIVGTEGVVSVKEKLKTVSIELEDLVGTSSAVDLYGEQQ